MSALPEDYLKFEQEYELAWKIAELQARKYIQNVYNQVLKNEEINAELEKPNIRIVQPQEHGFYILVSGCKMFDRISVICPPDRLAGLITFADGKITGISQIFETALFKRDQFVTSKKLGYQDDIKTFYTIDEIIEEIKNLFKII